MKSYREIALQIRADDAAKAKKHKRKSSSVEIDPETWIAKEILLTADRAFDIRSLVRAIAWDVKTICVQQREIIQLLKKQAEGK